MTKKKKLEIKPISWAERLTNGSMLVDLGYRDYIAARFLLNNQFFIQGLTLASTAVEKYLKSLIAFNLKETKKYFVHLDNIKELKKILGENNCDVTKDLDPIFLKLLELIYKIRYYDNIKRPFSIGFYLNQFIGELDNTIHLFETSFHPDISTNHMTPYKKAVKNKDLKLYKNNFILNKKDKKTFMEQPSTVFSVHIYVNSPTQTESTFFGNDITPPTYEGQLVTFTEFQPNWSVPK